MNIREKLRKNISGAGSALEEDVSERRRVEGGFIPSTTTLFATWPLGRYVASK